MASVVIITILAGCTASKPLNDSTVSATLWVQNSAEYEALTTMAYQSAEAQLDTALHTDSWTASLEQQGNDYGSLPPAVVLDVDETVLDNSAFQARLIKKSESYSSKKWNNWVREQKADPVPGALSFTQAAEAKGITVIYLTNRDVSVEEATYQNLKKVGFPLKKDVDVLLTNNERPGWSSDKTNRRKYVAENYRILMLLGDNLNDFLPAKDRSGSERKKFVSEHKNRLGTQWFVFPNPVYGSWEDALYNFDSSLSPEQIEAQKLEKLDTKN
ncbi:acid phosphatase [Fodinibius salinus]|uniref:Acid phosphatase n=1 Tax=Fodinibius salinus TaxID=860790 RepID=A0A5D3YIJ9_9BACT|nr:HAD family acid phosphatase [Fodinibius salinus]TYP92134.1 acid phosphatase [Fodinibius salinus]